MADEKAKRLIGELLGDFTPGSILHLLGEVLLKNDEKLPADPNRQERVRQAEAALFVFGLGLDAVIAN